MAKIGFSYSRCVRDIVEGRVDIDDVLVIISRTDFDPTDDKQWSAIWNGYRTPFGNSNPEWFIFKDEDEERFRNISIELWESGRLHQPRKFGARPQRMPYYWLETFAPYEEIADNPAVLKAWEKYKMLAGLSAKHYPAVNDDF